MTGRWPVTLLAVAGALGAGFAAQSSGSGVQAFAWALAAGIGLSLMVRGVGLRVLGVALTALAVAGAGWAGRAGLWLVVAGFAVAAVAQLGVIVWGPGWASRPRGPRAGGDDLWAAMDRGDDPTLDDANAAPGESDGSAPAGEQDVRPDGAAG